MKRLWHKLFGHPRVSDFVCPSGEATTSENTVPIRKLSDYLGSVANVSTHDEWWRRFIDLLHSLPKVQVTDLRIEKQEYEGRDYTVVGNLIFEFNRVMHKGWGDPTESLKRYMTNLKTQRPQTSFTAITTDGLSFHVYKPQFDEAGLVVKMEAIDGLNLASPMMTPEQAQQDLGHILSHLQG